MTSNDANEMNFNIRLNLRTSENPSLSKVATPLISATSPGKLEFSSSSSISLVTDRTRGGW